ncbi:outer membrane protein [Helicobacter cetorum]|uniref:Outer membrane protein HopL n=1 Tax=Helicobacter cetorum (strain ATCC BAA-429 / MIT 00-7128) TaxID=182217 RepID=I0EM74_HELC0|nr:outer membrane protein [Helicobacter cetorum]AFI04043.1 outer membrane protein HopL [Helicobacter cetorum MIT 00-7128]
MKKSKLGNLIFAGSLLAQQSILLAEDNGWYMSVGYQIGGTQQNVDNKQLKENQNTLNYITQTASAMANPNGGLLSLTSSAVASALGGGLATTASSQLQGIAQILGDIQAHRHDYNTNREIQSIQQQLIGQNGISNPITSHSAKLSARLLGNTAKNFQESSAITTQVLDTINSITPSQNSQETRKQLQNSIDAMNKLLQQVHTSVINAQGTSYVQTLFSELVNNVNQLSGGAKTSAITSLEGAINAYGVGYTTNNGVLTLNPLNPNATYSNTSVLGTTQENSKPNQSSSTAYNNTLAMNELSSSQSESLQLLIQRLEPLANDKVNSNIAQVAQQIQNVALQTLSNNALSGTTTALNNLYNALQYQASAQTVDSYQNSYQWTDKLSNGETGFKDPGNILQNTSGKGNIGTITNALGENITSYDCSTTTCKPTKSADNKMTYTPNDLKTLSQPEGGKIGINSYNLSELISQAYQSLQTSQANLKSLESQLNKVLNITTDSSGNPTSDNLLGKELIQLQNLVSSKQDETKSIEQALQNSMKEVSNYQQQLQSYIASQQSNIENWRKQIYGISGSAFVGNGTELSGGKKVEGFVAPVSGQDILGYGCFKTSQTQSACALGLGQFNKLINTIAQTPPTSLDSSSAQPIYDSAYYQKLYSELGLSQTENGNMSVSGGVLGSIIQNLNNQINSVYNSASGFDGNSSLNNLWNITYYNTLKDYKGGTNFAGNFTCSYQANGNGTCTISGGTTADAALPMNQGGPSKELEQMKNSSIKASQYQEMLSILKDASLGKLGTLNNGVYTPTPANNLTNGEDKTTPQAQSGGSLTPLQNIYNEAIKLQELAKGNKGVQQGLEQFFNNINMGYNPSGSYDTTPADSVLWGNGQTYDTIKVTATDWKASDSVTQVSANTSQPFRTISSQCHSSSGCTILIPGYDKPIDYTGTITIDYNLKSGDMTSQKYSGTQSVHVGPLVYSGQVGQDVYTLKGSAQVEIKISDNNKSGIPTEPITVSKGELVFGCANVDCSTTTSSGTADITYEEQKSYSNTNNPPVKNIANAWNNGNDMSVANIAYILKNGLCLNGDKDNTCTGGLINVLNSIPSNGVSDTNAIVDLLITYIEQNGAFQQNGINGVDSALHWGGSLFNGLVSALKDNLQTLQNGLKPETLLETLQELAKNTSTIQAFNQNLDELLGKQKSTQITSTLLQALEKDAQKIAQAEQMATSYASQPVLGQYVSGKSTQHGVSNGFGVSLGYKHFFGNARKLGLRYYGFFDYGYSKMGIGNQESSANVLVYGAGMDFLWNVFGRTYNTKAVNFGFFGGIQLAGTSWLSSLHNQIVEEWGNAKDINGANFQFLFNLGIRTNFAEFKRYGGKHRNKGVLSQQGVEFGIKIPTINQVYLKSAGADVSYRRLYVFYLNYVKGF